MSTASDQDDLTSQDANLSVFIDCLAVAVARKLGAANSSNTKKKRGSKGRENEIKPVVKPEDRGEDDVAELAEFTEYLAQEIFPALPAELRALSYAAVQDDAQLAERYSTPLDSDVVEALIQPLPGTIADSLCSYAVVDETSAVDRFLEPVLDAYVTATTAAPPEFTPSDTASRPDGCEICARAHVPLTYHHLIPRQVHSKAVKRGWHPAWALNKVAWLCRACHSYVHQIESNEELAREWYSVERLLEREDIRRWAAWVGRVRWKAR